MRSRRGTWRPSGENLKGTCTDSAKHTKTSAAPKALHLNAELNLVPESACCA